MLSPDVDSLIPQVPFDRRTFLKAAIGSGFAAAVLPVSAQTVHTDSTGLEAGPVSFESQGASVPAYRAQPIGKRHLPIVVVIHEIFGVHEHIADVCRRFAKLGYLAVAPDLYSRQGDASKYPSIQELNDKLVSKVPDASVMADLDAAVQWAAQNGGDADRLGVVGFCWGGRQAWLFAEHSTRPKAVVAFYGRVAGTRSGNTPSNPIDRAADLHAPVLGLYGLQDASIPQDTLEQMKAQIARGPQAARGSEFVVYPDAGHAFFADYRPSYRKADAEDAWRRTLAWFKDHGVA
ncbi:dienelactone hydrolase family protein [Trinickia caryophylli]|uniref:Carboxymethylenebutenolidase n=1 Tax=Trinickia caryophylli TaxID=28094 RepID=A0A1X7EFW9_TRICW|nr:dienelactone hydrolase family protein [Trinickia caryophylli]PMS11084.1 carboxymethylenebutenolidase [Trinickia caryophylli]TRX14540.1 dienelactone hydrolase family protein [Trinickia caryophylli]WQE14376.1 dienelactone hydrolase family protein [Trinickia caryophylli]SMF33323.1 carboxymethylenebutenolidase [Trinickia caryophylli]GLU32229.1 carboxymethylenebutenolidase [Trinickia caryophylli]